MIMLSAIILSNTIDEEIYQMNYNCIISLLNSEDWDAIGGLEIILIESNINVSYIYENCVKVVVPKEPFNFNRFLNIGIEHSNGQYLAFCNNDIIFFPKWFSEILRLKTELKTISCFSPVDRNYVTMSNELFPENKRHYIGWKNKYHFAAWCFVLEKDIFSIIGKFDEKFDFYFADDDFLMTLRKYALTNALVIHSHVKHISQQVTKKIASKTTTKRLDKETYPIPDKYLKRGFDWLWDDIRFYKAFFNMEKKWGDEKTIKRINQLFDILPLLRKRGITKILYSKRANSFLTKISKI